MIDPGFTSPGERRNYWPLLRAAAVVVLVLLAGRWAVRQLDREAVVADQQSANHERLLFYVEALERYASRTGGYPANLVDSLEPGEIPGGIARGLPLRDVWDHPLRYFSDGSIFLLVSVGSDGEPDGDEYSALRTAHVARDICGSPQLDVVVSDLGWHAACLADRPAMDDPPADDGIE